MNQASDHKREIELKLEADDSAQLEGLRSHPALAEVAQQMRDLPAVYFDTSDGALRKAGLAFRIRRENGRWLQTLKSTNSSLGVGLDRKEWETKLRSFKPNLKKLEASPLFEVLPDGAALRPVFEAQVHRSSTTIRCDTSEIELSIDIGSIRTEAGSVPICEVELELKDGSPNDLYLLAASLVETTPLRVSLLTKADRGYRALTRQQLQRLKAEPLVLRQDMTMAQAFQVIARSCLRHLLANEHVLRQTQDPEAVHQMRVAIRRLRAGMTLFKSAISDGEVETVKADLRGIADTLGQARDLDVYLGNLRHPADKNRTQDADLRRTITKAEAEREQAYANLTKSLRPSEFTPAILRLSAWVEAGPWLSAPDREAARIRPILELAQDQLSRRWRTVRRRSKQLTAMNPEERHELRIAIKKLRYGMEFFGSLFDVEGTKKRFAKALRAVEALQETLGQLNDIAVASQRDRPGRSKGFQAKRKACIKNLLKTARAQAETLADRDPF